MKISAKYKIYGGVLGIAVIALVADQLTRSSGPAEVDASQLLVNPQSVQSSAGQSPKPAAIQPIVDTPSIAQVLRSAARNGNWIAANPADARDPMRSTSAWGDAATGDVMVGQPAPVARFMRAHRLSTIITSAGSRHAMVDGRILGIGQTLDTFTLVAITSSSATFESSAGHAILRIENQAR